MKQLVAIVLSVAVTTALVSWSMYYVFRGSICVFPSTTVLTKRPVPEPPAVPEVKIVEVQVPIKCPACPPPLPPEPPPPQRPVIRHCPPRCAKCNATTGACVVCVEGAVWPEHGCTVESLPNDVMLRFEQVYAQSRWGDAGGRSGPGSSIESTRNTVAALHHFIDSGLVSSIWDASCGSMIWMKGFLESMEAGGHAVQYFGTDVVRPLIADHRRNFAGHPNWHFGVLDMTRGHTAKGADLVIVRDTLFHLSFRSIWDALDNINRSNSTWLLTTCHANIGYPVSAVCFFWGGGSLF